MLLLLFSCNNYQNTEKNSVSLDSPNNRVLEKDSSIVALNKQTLKNESSNDSINNKNVVIRGGYSYLTNDTLYITDVRGVTILLYYLSNHTQNKKGIDIDINILEIKELIQDNYLYLSIYTGDALPYKAILIDLKRQKIIVENSRYQFYLGHSANGLYHSFAGGSSGSGGDLAIYSSKNELLKETYYYESNSDTNQLKWLGNEFYYYSDIDKNFSNKGSAWSPETSLINVQKYLWKENKTFPLNEFTKAFME
jgi:hypothetical protein